MKKSKIILAFKFLFIFVCIFYTICYLKNNKSKLNGTETELVGIINEIKYGKSLIIKLNNNEKVLISTYNENDYKLGDKIKAIGTLKTPNTNSNFNLFNYKKYLLSKQIYYIMYATKIEKISNNNKWYYNVKQKIVERIDKQNSSDYLKALIIGDNSSLDLTSYQENGISHLFAISGMHITIFTAIISILLKKLIKNKKLIFIIITIFLLFYIFITSFSVSVMRASFLYILVNLCKLLNLKIKAIELLILLCCIFLLFNPYYIYSISFQFSFIVCFYLILFSNLINKYKNYFIKILITSFIAVLSIIPIQINSFYDINFFSIILNIIFIPLFSFIIFPLSILIFFIPQLDFIFNVFIIIFNNTSLIFSKITLFKFSFSNISICFIIYYYFIITFVLYMIYRGKCYYFILIIITLIIHFNIRFLIFNSEIIFLDVGQGDSLILSFKNNTGNVLIDTGGNNKFDLSKNIIIPYLKSIGVHKLDYLILTHGDFDHMGEAINLVNNFKVEKVIFNCGEFNELEQELIKVLDKKHIKYYSCINELNIDKNKLYFLQTKEYDNENDNSNVIYTDLNGYKFMFMGDASVTTEKEIMNKYNLQYIDILKVGHHGSKTSSSKEFINEINPKYSVISVGKNNRYGHPNKEVLNNLANSKIYRTDEDGSIMFKIKNSKLKIETCTQ